MNFNRLTWRNLFSYGDYETSIELNKGGLVFVRGVNKDTGTSNGSGKCVHADTEIVVKYSNTEMKQALGKRFDEFKEIGLKPFGKIRMIEVVELFEKFPKISKALKVSTPQGFYRILAAKQTAFEKPVELTLRSGLKLICSKEHRIMSKGNWVHAKDLQGKAVKVLFGTDIVQSVKELDEEMPLYDIEVEEVHQYWSNNILSHNSSIVDIFSWALFGKPVKTLPIDNIRNFDSDGPSHAKVEFTAGGDFYELIRYRGHRKHGNGVFLYKNGELDPRVSDGTSRDAQKYINSVIGLDYSSFVASFIFTSEVDFEFPRVTADKRRSHLEQLLGMQAFSDYGAAFRQNAKEIKGKIDEYAVLINERTANLRRELEDKEKYEELRDSFEDDKEASIRRFKDELSKAVSTLESLDLTRRHELEVEISSLSDELDTISERRADIERAIRENEFKLKTILSDIDSIKKDAATKIKHARNIAEREIKALQKKLDLLDSECPTCGRGWDEHESTELSSTYEGEINEVKSSLAANLEGIEQAAAERIEELRADEQSVKDAIDELKEDLSELDIDTRKAHIKGLKAELDSLPDDSDEKALRSKIESLRKRIEEDSQKSNPYEQIVSDIDRRIEIGEREIKGLESKIKDLEDEYKYVSFWDDSFNGDGLKTYVFDGVLPILNARIGHYLPLMFEDREVSLTFDTMMNMEITIDGQPYSYGNLSKGERKRVDLSVALGLLESAQAQHGITPNVMFFDEIFDSSLDSQGVRVVTDILHTIPVQTIFVISHRLEIANEFDDVIDVEKDGMYSYIRA